MARLLPASQTSQADADAVSCRKRPRADSELQSFPMRSHLERERKIHRSSSSELRTAASPQASAVDQSRSSTSSGSACYYEDDNLADQICVFETIKSLEAELGVRADQEASSCSRDEDRLGICGSVQLLSNPPCSAESELLSWEDETADSVVDSCSSAYTELPFRDDTILAESFTSDHPHLDFSFHLEMLDDQLGLLRNLSSEHLQALTRYREAETICSFQSLAEDAYACTHLDEDIWGLGEAHAYAQDINVR